MTYKPTDYTSVSPYLLAPDAQALIDFLIATFEAVPLRRMERENGSVSPFGPRPSGTTLTGVAA